MGMFMRGRIPVFIDVSVVLNGHHPRFSRFAVDAKRHQRCHDGIHW